MKVHRCPSCGYIISDAVLKQALYDYACPRCLMKHFSDFSIEEMGPNEPAGNTSPA
jgi:rubredoxin